MDKYDHEEEQKVYEKSDAFKKKIQDKKDNEIEKQQKEITDLELTLGNLEDSKKLAGRATGLSDREQHAAEDDEFINTMLEQYQESGKKGAKIITKAKAKIAAGKCIEKWRGLKGEQNKNYLNSNFDDVWSQHDVQGKNTIEVSEAYQFLKEI